VKALHLPRFALAHFISYHQRFVGMQLESQESQESKRRAGDDVRQRYISLSLRHRL
jgi:hypothetical protein